MIPCWSLGYEYRSLFLLGHVLPGICCSDHFICLRCNVAMWEQICPLGSSVVKQSSAPMTIWIVNCYESTNVCVCMSISFKRFAQLVFILPYHNIIYLRCSSTISKHQTECWELEDWMQAFLLLHLQTCGSDNGNPVCLLVTMLLSYQFTTRFAFLSFSE